MRLPRNAQIWGPAYVKSMLRRWVTRPRGDRPIDILFCVADHFEPDHGGASLDSQMRRVHRWVREYPIRVRGIYDSDGRPPRHTFFYPLEAYAPPCLNALSELTQAGYGEVEVHVHHDGETSNSFRKRLIEFRNVLSQRHGMLSVSRSGEVKYGFIHGNWALDNSRPDGRWCGVNDELSILLDTGCYADFTMPSAPDMTQTRTVNSIYYASDDPDRPKSHDAGIEATANSRRSGTALLMVQGPLAVTWDKRPRLENGAIDATTPPSLARFRAWLECQIAVAGRPEWVFVKVHTHGAKDSNADVLLGGVMRAFHQQLASNYNDGLRFRLHYVTARELVNIVLAAESGETGNAGRYRDYMFRPLVRD